MTEVAEDIRQWLAGGHTGTVASVDGSLRPHMVRLWGVHAGAERDTIEVFVLASDTERFLASLEQNANVAVNVIEPPTYRSVMFKGCCTVRQHRVQPEHQAELLAGIDEGFVRVGLEPGSGALMRSHYANADLFTVLLVRVEQIFDQTPKPGAGARLA